MEWFLLVPINFLATLLGYLLNPIVGLFVKDDGWLPKWLYWFQTYDNTLDVGWFVKEEMPSFLRYDYDKHYTYTEECSNPDGSKTPGFTTIINNNFTILEKIKRYICRLGWMYRNCTYGFSYSVMGRDVNYNNQYVIADVVGPKGSLWFSYIQDEKGLWGKTWCFFWNHQYSDKYAIKIFLGWKIQNCIIGKGHDQIANHINFFKSV